MPVTLFEGIAERCERGISHLSSAHLNINTKGIPTMFLNSRWFMRTGTSAAAITVAVLASANSAGANEITTELGPAYGYVLLGLTGSISNLSSGPLVFNGGIGVDSGASLAASGGGRINGTVFADPGATVNTSGVTVTGGTTTQSMSSAQNAAIAASTFFDSLTPTQSFSTISSSTTITGNGGVNVINIGSGGINLSGGALTISGGSNDIFVFQVNGASSVQGGAQIVLNGVSPNQVLFDFPFTATWAVQQSSNGAVLQGIFLAPHAGFNINGSNTTSDTAEFITGSTANFQSNPVVNAVPLPASGWLLLSALGAMGLLVRRNRSESASLPGAVSC